MAKSFDFSANNKSILNEAAFNIYVRTAILFQRL
jgi:hypothetical protein